MNEPDFDYDLVSSQRSQKEAEQREVSGGEGTPSRNNKVNYREKVSDQEKTIESLRNEMAEKEAQRIEEIAAKEAQREEEIRQLTKQMESKSAQQERAMEKLMNQLKKLQEESSSKRGRSSSTEDGNVTKTPKINEENVDVSVVDGANGGGDGENREVRMDVQAEDGGLGEKLSPEKEKNQGGLPKLPDESETESGSESESDEESEDKNDEENGESDQLNKSHDVPPLVQDISQPNVIPNPGVNHFASQDSTQGGAGPVSPDAQSLGGLDSQPSQGSQAAGGAVQPSQASIGSQGTPTQADMFASQESGTVKLPGLQKFSKPTKVRKAHKKKKGGKTGSQSDKSQ